MGSIHLPMDTGVDWPEGHDAHAHTFAGTLCADGCCKGEHVSLACKVGCLPGPGSERAQRCHVHDAAAAAGAHGGKCQAREARQSSVDQHIQIELVRLLLGLARPCRV